MAARPATRRLGRRDLSALIVHGKRWQGALQTASRLRLQRRWPCCTCACMPLWASRRAAAGSAGILISVAAAGHCQALP